MKFTTTCKEAIEAVGKVSDSILMAELEGRHGEIPAMLPAFREAILEFTRHQGLFAEDRAVYGFYLDSIVVFYKSTVARCNCREPISDKLLNFDPCPWSPTYNGDGV